MFNKSKSRQLIVSLVVKVTLASTLLTILQACYIVKQGYHQFKLMGEMRPFREVLSDPKIPEKIKEKIEKLTIGCKGPLKYKRVGAKETGSDKERICIVYRITQTGKVRVITVYEDNPR